MTHICNICFDKTEDLIGPNQNDSCHFCCKTCFEKQLKYLDDSLCKYKCPWCRVDYVIHYQSSNEMTFDYSYRRDFDNIWDFLSDI